MKQMQWVYSSLSYAGRHWKVAAGLCALAAMMLWAGGACTAKVPAGRLPAPGGDAVPADAVLLTVTNQALPTRIDVVGTVASEETIHLSARITAYVKEVFVSAGSEVKQGELLLRLDDREIQERLSAASARLRQAETEFNRAKRLLETNATTKQSVDAAESAFRSARAEVDGVKVMVTYTEIVSPIDGMVTDRRIEAGDLANPGQVLLSIYDPGNMRLEAPVPVRLVKKLGKGETVSVVLDRPAGTFTGRVTEIVGEVDPRSRTQMVKIHLEELAEPVLPGTFGRAWVDEDEHDGILLPSEAVMRIGQLEFVNLVRDGEAVRRLVKTGPRHGADVEILSGLDPSDVVLRHPGMDN